MRIYKHEGKSYSFLEYGDFPNTEGYLGILNESFFKEVDYLYNCCLDYEKEGFQLRLIKTFKNNLCEFITEVKVDRLRKTKKSLIKQAHEIDLAMCKKILEYVIKIKKL